MKKPQRRVNGLERGQPQLKEEGQQMESKKIEPASPQETGGPAFPEVFTDHRWSNKHSDFMQDTYSAGGMTLRDYFAGKAMTGLIADPERVDQSRKECARLSYLMADAMIEARKAVAA